MPISDLCTRSLVKAQRGESLQNAAQKMKKHCVGGIVVVESDANGLPIGILTDRDIAISMAVDNRSPQTNVEEIMSRAVVTAKQSDGIASVVELMEQEGVRRVVLVDDEGIACGIVSSDDILQLVGKEISGLGKLVGQQTTHDPNRPTSQRQLLI